MEKIIDKGQFDPMQIGFVSFTRAARHEAAVRAAEKFGLDAATLERGGWFRTLHSVAYKQLGIAPGELLAGSIDDDAWLKNALGDEKARVAVRDDNDDCLILPSDPSVSGKALALWDAARNRQIPVESLWERADATDDRTPPLDLCHSYISLYEDAKRRDGRLDFCDLLMLFAGKRWTGNHGAPFVDEEPHGETPHVPVFFHDEAQDASLLSSLVFLRATRESLWTYIMADMRQAIYGWAGSDGTIFGEHWPVAKEEILPTCYRCRQNILDYADGIMERGGHSKRPFASKEKGGDIIRTDWQDAMRGIKAGEDTLVLGRTNDYARNAANFLDDEGIPWRPTKGGGGFNAPARAAGVVALLTLRNGGGINGEGVHRIMQLLPVIAAGTRLFEVGAKKFYDGDGKQSHAVVPLTLKDAEHAGGTEAFKELVSSGKYVELLEKPAARMAVAAQRHGIDAVQNPKIRVGTMHSAKGQEADNVVMMNKIPYPTKRAIEDPEGMEEERRVWYVTATRARKKLTIADEGRDGEGFPDL